MPRITACNIPVDDLRILELGSGLGTLAYGFSRVTRPRLYLATDLFPELLSRLRSNLDAWNMPSPIGLVGAVDADKPIALRAGVVNVVLACSVLHHVLQYRSCIERLAQLLDSPGAIICAEPTKDGWAYYLSFINLVLRLAEPPYQAVTLSDQGLSILSHIRQNLTSRMARCEDLEYLATLEDKHIFSFAKLRELAKELGLDFEAFRPRQDIYALCTQHLKAIGIPHQDVDTVSPLLQSMIPEGARDAEFSSLAQIVCFSKS